MTTEAEARKALADVERRRGDVINAIGLPRWYWWGLASGWVLVGVVNDLDHVWLSAIASLLFGAVHASVANRALSGRNATTRLSVRADVAGHHAVRLVLASLAGLVLLTIAVGVATSADGAEHPATIAGIVVAIVIMLGHPFLVAEIRRQAARAATPR
jgi:hypothetical protein